MPNYTQLFNDYLSVRDLMTDRERETIKKTLRRLIQDRINFLQKLLKLLS
jgi:hypothetical protein